MFRTPNSSRLVGALFLCSGLLCGVLGASSAQDPIRFRRLGVDEGVSHTTVWDVAQDTDGFVWLVTETSLQRYDGYEFREYVHDPLAEHSLASRDGQAILADRRGRLWVGGARGQLSLYDRAMDRFDRFEPPFGVDFLIDLTDDREGNLWLTAIGGGVARFAPGRGDWRVWGEAEGIDPEFVGPVRVDLEGNAWIVGELGVHRLSRGADRVQTYRLEETSESPPWARGLALSADGAVWVGSGQGSIFRYDSSRDRFECEVAIGTPICHLEVAPNGDLWVGTCDRGIAVYSPAGGRLSHHRFDASDPDSLSADEVLQLTFAGTGEAWIATRNGVSIHDAARSAFRVLGDRRDGTGLDGDRAQTLEVTDDGALWIGMANGAVHRWQPDVGVVETVFSTVEAPVGPIEYLGSTDAGEVVLGGLHGTLHIDPNTRLASTEPAESALTGLRGFVETADGARWYASLDDGLVRLTEAGRWDLPVDAEDPTKLPDAAAYAVSLDRSGIVWAGFDTGVARIDPTTEAIRSWRHDPADPASLAGGIVPAIYEDRAGRLWIATYGTGLDRFDRDTETFHHFTTRDGLASDFVVGLVEDDRGRLWISTNRGIGRLDPASETFRSYDVTDGLASNVFLMGGVGRFADGRLVFSGQGGVTVFHPDALVVDTTPPPVALTTLAVGGVEVRPGEEGSPLETTLSETELLTLGHKQGTFAIGFSALHFGNPSQNRYAFQLQGVDSGWTEVDARSRRARYTNLDPGEYTFRVNASNSDGYWNEGGASLRIRVLPPWWQTWWATTIYSLAVLALIAGYAFWQQRRVEEERAINARLRQIDRMKNDFLANTSHELRTPLFGMTGLAESLLDGARGGLAEPVVEDLRMIVSSGRRLSSLVDDLLDFSRLRDHDLDLDTRALNLHSVVELILTLSRSLAEGKELDLVNAVPRDLPQVLADENRLQQILMNLLGNAVKFTDQGSIVVSAEPVGDAVRVDVEDTGIGISAEQLERIFDPFEQVDGSVSRSFGGTGLGLAITRDLVQLHGGEIEVESTLGEGSSFHFTLPLASPEAVSAVRSDSLVERDVVAVDAAPTRPSETTAPGPDTGERQPTVLVVDDEPVVRQVLVNQLSSAGYSVLEATSGPEALRLLPQGPDLVLLDIMMPRMSGFEVCDSIRQRYSLEQLPVIYLTAKSQAEDLLHGFATGANDFLSKPVIKDELLARVSTHLELRRLHAELERALIERTEQVKTLGDLLPICSGCKKIRDDDGYWQEVETFLDTHSSASFTHGLCEQCIEQLYPEIEKVD